ncbi:Rieske 2Fe-2S domain-containing protein [Nocardioides sp. cx-173]|uniref:Rieske 2Fe-2S domain-containing protein n=1 Tax=Nocardioides sp. cx-173 TaxID=2898796 RepID=UPI001E4D3716|nr:Rieske 2Fe-2S domain-containing protein [Nocardioides sp. cx-173]MCD4526624.1 Rieske 2Fe-2S domain-containing protein [Nocardioides sp. cx-173]UGB40717.1 Rieske 2Fe-2S domain-containing protein [Nocardioides sp. cx-173]
MLSVEDNEVLTRTGRGTPMGELFRRFWIPALLSSELPQQGGPAVKVGLLGEKLIAFRGKDGKVGLLESRCPHRHANLYWGRNEEDGLRCVYHGWKFGFDGACLDMPAEPVDSTYKDRVKAVAYPTHEAGGIIWTYLGPADVQPDFPLHDWTLLPESHSYVSKRHQRCNYFQNIEGELDTAHVQFLHRELGEHDFAPQKRFDTTGNPEYTIAETPVGMLAVAQRALPDGGSYWRITPFLMPASTIVPARVGERYTFTAAIPIDDTSMWGFTVTWLADRPLSAEELERERSGLGLHVRVDPETFVPVANMDNDYLRDLEVMATQNFTGIMGVRSQDLPVQEDQDGPICERHAEHLGTTDRAIVAARRLMLRTAKSLAQGIEPTQPQRADAFRQRSLAGDGTAGQTWDELFNAAQHQGQEQTA